MYCINAVRGFKKETHAGYERGYEEKNGLIHSKRKYP